MKRTTRPPVKQDAIIEQVRSAIVDGRLHPGDRLPPRCAYEEEFGVSSVTVQRAFDRLVADGFIQVRGSDGTYVTGAPPHLYRYAIAFPHAFGGEVWSQFFTAVLQVAATLEGVSPRKLPAYMGVDERSKPEGYRNLLRDMRAHRVAGIVFIGEPRLPADSAILAEQGVPRVILTSSPTPLAGAVRVDLGGAQGFVGRAMAYLAEKGRKRVAKFCVGGVEQERIDYYFAAAARYGLKAESYWLQGVEVAQARWAAHAAHLMFRDGQKVRPDALLISDDNLVEHTCRGLVQAGVRVPEDVEVVAHCNFPTPSPSVLPLARLGYDIRQALETCMGLIDAHHRGETIPEHTVIAPCFEWEVHASRGEGETR